MMLYYIIQYLEKVLIQGKSAFSRLCNVLSNIAYMPVLTAGWVWSFSSNSSGDLVSGSWDNTVKFWRLAPAALRETRKPVNLKVAVLSTDMRANTVVAGTYDKRVVIMDTR